MRFAVNESIDGQFYLSDECVNYIKKKYDTDFPIEYLFASMYYKNPVSELEYRSDPKLLDAIDTLGLKTCQDKLYTKLKVVTVPDEYSIDDLEIFRDRWGIETIQTIPTRFN